MKRFAIFLLMLIMLSLAAWTASAETLGWGFVNNTDVALRRGIGGNVIVRLPKDTCVFITDSQASKDGVLWYEVRTGLHINHANYDFSGWMKADFIDAGTDVWHDVAAIAANTHGLIALRADGSTETAGRPIVAMDGSGWVSPRGWADAYGRAIHVGTPGTGNEYYIVTENDELVSSLHGLRVANGLEKAAAMEAAEIAVEDIPFPTWSSDAETIVFRWTAISIPAEELPVKLYIGIRADGSVMAEPSFIAELLADWSDLMDIRVTGRYVLGLKKNGTVLFAPLVDGMNWDVSQWQGVRAIGAGDDWCVGLKHDGTLVFEGDHVFMNEGRLKK